MAKDVSDSQSLPYGIQFLVSFQDLTYFSLLVASRTEEEGSLPKEGELLVRLPIDELQQEG